MLLPFLLHFDNRILPCSPPSVKPEARFVSSENMGSPLSTNLRSYPVTEPGAHIELNDRVISQEESACQFSSVKSCALAREPQPRPQREANHRAHLLDVCQELSLYPAGRVGPQREDVVS